MSTANTSNIDVIKSKIYNLEALDPEEEFVYLTQLKNIAEEEAMKIIRHGYLNAVLG